MFSWIGQFLLRFAIWAKANDFHGAGTICLLAHWENVLSLIISVPQWAVSVRVSKPAGEWGKMYKEEKYPGKTHSLRGSSSQKHLRFLSKSEHPINIWRDKWVWCKTQNPCGASAISKRARKAFKQGMMSWETKVGWLLLKQNTENFVSGQTEARLSKQT